MLGILKQDAQIGDSINLYLTTGDTVKGTIIEIGDNYLLLDVEGIRRRYFPQLIGGWDVIKNDSTQSNLVVEDKETIGKEKSKINEEFEYGIISLFDDIYKENHIELTEKIITNATVDSISVSGVKVTTDKGEQFVCHKGFMVGFSRANCTPGKRLFCGMVNKKNGICYFSMLEMSYEELRTRYVTAILTKPAPRKPIINSILAYFRRISSGKTTFKIIEDLSNRIKSLDDPIEFLLSKKEYEKVFEQIEKSIEVSSDDKQKASLFLKKAQLYSSLKDNEKAILAYKDLISFNESIDAPAKSISRFYTELARLLHLVGDEDNAIEARNKALTLNPQNTIAKRIDFGKVVKNPNSGKNHVINPESNVLINTIKLVNNNLIDDDIEHHSFIDSEIVSLNGKVTNEIANRLLEDASTSENHLQHLEAAKALKCLPVGSYDVQDFEDSVTNYSIYKCESLFNSYKKVVSESDSLENIPLEQLDKIKDCTICYSVEAIDNLADEDNDVALRILTNCLLLELSSLFIKTNKTRHDILEILSLTTEQFVLRCTSSEWTPYTPSIFVKLVILSTKCTYIWDVLVLNSSDYSILLSYINDNLLIKEEIVALTPKNKRLRKDGNNADFINLFRQYVNNKQVSCYRKLVIIEDTKFELSSIRSLLKICKQLTSKVHLWCFNDSDQRSLLDVNHLVALLSLYQKKNKDERKIIISNVLIEIDKVLRWNNGTTATKIGRFYFYPLLVTWRETLAKMNVQDDYNDSCLLSLEMDSPYYYVNEENNKSFKIVLHNKGILISEGYQLSVWVGDNHNNGIIREEDNYILPNEDVQIVIPISQKRWGDHDYYEFNFSICSKYQGKWSNKVLLNTSIMNKRDVTFKLADIKWHDSGYPPHEMFKGRDTIVEELKSHYCSNIRYYSYVLYGLSKTGKSSILHVLKESIEGCELNGLVTTKVILPLFVDLGEIYGLADEEGNFWNSFIDVIFKQTEDFISRRRPEVQNTLVKPKGLSDYLEEMKNLLIHPLFMLDEFSFMKNLIEKRFVNSAFLQYMRHISADKDLASFIFVGTYDIKQLIHDPKYNISGAFTYLREPDEPLFSISKKSAEELINTMKGKLDFSSAAIRNIHKLSGDVPFWIQKLCYNCAVYSIDNNRPVIGLSELETIVSKMTGESPKTNQNKSIPRMNSGTFKNSQTLSSDTEEMKIVLTSISYLMKESKQADGVTFDQIKALWSENGYDITIYNIKEAIDSLCERKTLTYEDVEEMRYYSFSIDLFRRWWHHEHFVFELELSTFIKGVNNDT